ncbi:MAG: hypothetical protein LBK75_02790 [Oscillospiraceae bacterium]|nr:hypothetical protein [Oscillospiraceae bacterium]
MAGRGLNREGRRNTYYGDAGVFCEMDSKFRAGCMQNVNRTFMQAQQCPLVTAVRVMQSISNSVIIAHSPLGCSGGMAMENSNVKLYRTMTGAPYENSRVLSTNLDERDVIMGGENKLRRAVEEAVRRYDPEVISIMMSCASGIIGDDVEAVIEEMQPDLKAVLVPVFCEGFRSKIPITGSDVAFHGIQKYLFRDIHPARQDNLVNVFILPTCGALDRAYLTEMLAALGLEANFLPFAGSLADFRRMTSARVSTSVCSAFADDLLAYLWQTYDIPYTRFVLPIGSEETDEWLRGIAREVGRETEAEAYLARERARYMPKVREIRQRIQGKRVVITTNLMRSLSNMALARDFGFEVAAVQTALYDDFLSDELAKLSDTLGAGALLTLNGAQAYEQANLIQKLDADLFLGMGVDQARRQGVPAVFQVDRKSVTFGYRGLASLAVKLADALENPNFVKKLAAHKKLPYRDAWYAENAFKYMV